MTKGPRAWAIIPGLPGCEQQTSHYASTELKEEEDGSFDRRQSLEGR